MLSIHRRPPTETAAGGSGSVTIEAVSWAMVPHIDDDENITLMPVALTPNMRYSRGTLNAVKSEAMGSVSSECAITTSRPLSMPVISTLTRPEPERLDGDGRKR